MLARPHLCSAYDKVVRSEELVSEEAGSGGTAPAKQSSSRSRAQGASNTHTATMNNDTQRELSEIRRTA